MRKKKRLRISTKRAASLNAAAGLLMLVFAMLSWYCGRSGLDLAAGGFDRRARALGHRHALERHRLGKRTGEHHLAPLVPPPPHPPLPHPPQLHHPPFDLAAPSA